MLIEQAVFTSARTDRAAGYQLVAKSPGVDDRDARQLAAWGPSHDSLWDASPGAESVNFFPLPSGAWCVSKTSAEAQEYSARGGQQVYTQCLVVPRDTLLRFANNPFALLRAALAQGSLRVDHPAGALEPIALVGRASAVDQPLLTRLGARLGPRRLAGLVQAALSSDALAITAGAASAELVAALLNCLPPECRGEFSFSTGLRVSSCRPFRVVGLPEGEAEMRQALRRRDACVFSPAAEPPEETVLTGGWPEVVYRVLSAGKISSFAARLSAPHAGLHAADLAAWSAEWLAELNRAGVSGSRRQPPRATKPPPPAEEVSRRTPARQEEKQRADAPHPRFAKSARAAAEAQEHGSPAESLAARLPADSPQIAEQLEVLDATVHDAIAGSAAALEHLKTLWPVILDELGEDLVAEWRERYLQYALRLWSQSSDSDGVPDPSRAVAALDVLCLMFNEE